MESFSALLALWAGNSQVTGEFPTQKASKADFGFFVAVKQTVDWPVIVMVKLGPEYKATASVTMSMQL